MKLFPEKKTNVFMLTAQPVALLGFRALLEETCDLRFAGYGRSFEDAETLIRIAKPDVVVVDFMGNKPGLPDICHLIESGFPCVAYLTEHWQWLARFLFSRLPSATARGYCSKHDSDEKFLGCIRTVAGAPALKENGFPKTVIYNGSESENPFALLCPRQCDVFCLLGRGLATRSIARRMGISHKTVSTYYSRIKQAFSLPSLTELTRAAQSAEHFGITSPNFF